MNLSLLEQFKKKTGYDIESFFNDYIFFVQNYYQNIINYYNGSDINKDAFNYLEYLQNETYKIEPLIDQYSNAFNTTDFWDLNNNFTDIQTKIETCVNMGRWQRSSRADRFSSNLKVEHIQKQNETIESISRDAGFSNVDEWANIALANQAIEEDYTNLGGKLLNVKLNNNTVSSIDNIVDYLVGNNILGKDIKTKITILPDGDLDTVQYSDAISQTFATIMSTLKGSVPEFPDDGIPATIFGTNENVIQYPIMFRSLLSIIQKDKRFTGLELIDIKKDQDNVFLELQASAITGDKFVNNITI